MWYNFKILLQIIEVSHPYYNKVITETFKKMEWTFKWSSIPFYFIFNFPQTFIVGILLYAFDLLAFVNAIKILANL